MKSFALLIFFNLFLFNVQGQKTIGIPEFKNINPDDKYPAASVLAGFANDFEILISLNEYSIWGPDDDIMVLAFNKTGWYKIEIKMDKLYFDPNTVSYSTYKINDTIGKMVWDSLIQNHLFEMEDERSKNFKCITKIDTIKYNNGEIEYIEEISTIDDGPEYQFQIITKYKYKKLYFYCPQEFLKICNPIQERKWFVNCISIFEKYLGN